MITAFVGTPGSGKTYDAVKKIVDNLRPLPDRKQRTIYTNIEGMDDPACQQFIKDLLGFDDYEFNKYFIWKSDSEIINFYEYVKDNSLIVIDEIHKLFSNRDWNTDKNKKFSDWCSTHRHHGCDLIFITQDMEKVEKHVRSLVQWSYLYRKVDFMGSAVKMKYIKYSYSGDDVKGKPLATNTATYDSNIFRCYKTFSSEDAKELGFMTHVNIFKHPVFYSIPVILCVTLYLFFGRSSFATGDILGSKKAMKTFESRIASSPAPSAPVPSAPVPLNTPAPLNLPVQPSDSMVVPLKNTTVVGIVSSGDLNIVLLSDGRSVKTSKKYTLYETLTEDI